MSKEKILLIDDEEIVRWPLKKWLTKEGFQVVEAATCADGVREATRGDVDLIILDLKLPDGSGVDVLKQVKEVFPDLPVIMMTAFGSVTSAVEALKLGAFDFISKPCNLEELTHLIKRALELSSLKQEVQNLRKQVRKNAGFEAIVGKSPTIARVLEMIDMVAKTDMANVLLLGESGTGKNLIAEAIHNHSPRSSRPFVTVTCTAMPGELIESELFGFERGAFTDAKNMKKGLCEIADGGTLFLDEIGDIPLPLQAKLLGFIESQTFRRIGGTTDIKVNLRIVAATNRNLKEEIKLKNFREDLFYRLNVSRIELPPLRNRPEDVPLLVDHFIQDLNRKLNKEVEGVNDQVRQAMVKYPWPGNIRELKNMLERAMIFAREKRLGKSDFPMELFLGPDGSQHHMFVLPPEGLDFEALERSLVLQALERANGNQAKAGRLLQFTRDQMRYRVKQYGLFGKTSDED